MDWCEALFEKNGCRKFALILEKPKTGQHLPTPLSWDAKLSSTRKPIESGDFPWNGFRSYIKRGFWQVSAHLAESSPQDFFQTPEMMKKWWKLWKNRKSQNRTGIIQESSLGSRKSFLLVSDQFWCVRDNFFVSGKNRQKYDQNYGNHDFFFE